MQRRFRREDAYFVDRNNRTQPFGGLPDIGVMTNTTTKTTKSTKTIKTTKVTAHRTASSSSADPGDEKDYQSLVDVARALPASSVRALRFDLSRAFKNGSRGAAIVLARESEVVEGVPEVSPDEIRRLPRYASAIWYGNTLIRQYEPTPDEVKAKLVRGRQLRKLLMACADALVVAGTVSAAVVAKIHKGTGAMDTAQDCIDLAALLAPVATTAKIPVSQAEIQEAREVGERLQDILRPRDAKRDTDLAHAAAIDTRDRMWTLYEQAWENHVWLAGAYLFRRAVDKNIPSLGAREPKRSRKEPEPAPAPVAPPPVAPTPAAPTPVAMTASGSAPVAMATSANTKPSGR